MSKVVHQSHITITREKGPTRRAEIEGFGEPVFYGVHGGIKDFYNIEPEEEQAVVSEGVRSGWRLFVDRFDNDAGGWCGRLRYRGCQCHRFR